MAAQTGTTVITIRHPRDAIEVSSRKQETLANLEDYLGAFANGAKGLGGSVDVKQSTSSTVEVGAPIGTSAAAASGTVTISSGSGSITATINGVDVAVTWATSDTATATALAAAIVAETDALVDGLVTATSALGVVTVTASLPGVTGNCITLAASGTGATASGARLTGGVNGAANSLTY